MRVIRIDRIDGTKKTGFAKYCPTFARLPRLLEERRELKTVKKIICSGEEAREKLLAEMEKNPDKTVETLGKLLFHKSPSIAQLAAVNLWYLSTEGYNMHQALGELMVSTSSDNEKVKKYSQRALTIHYLRKGNFEAFGRLLFTADKDLLSIRQGINDIIGNADGNAIAMIVTTIDGVLKSRNFHLEMGKNSPRYVSIITACAWTMWVVQERIKEIGLELTSFSPPSRS